jgi:hypothetical protein
MGKLRIARADGRPLLEGVTWRLAMKALRNPELLYVLAVILVAYLILFEPL